MPPYDATVVDRLRKAGLPILGKTNMDEFAMGSSTEHSAYGPTHTDRGTSTGSRRLRRWLGRRRRRVRGAARDRHRHRRLDPPARRVTGTVGVKPTYGGVSRYGLVALANSLDQAVVTRTVLDSALLHEVIGGHDPLDSTSFDQPLPSLVDAARQGATGDMSGVRSAS